MHKGNDYYSIALNDLEFMYNSPSDYTPNIVSLCEQACERLLQSVVVVECDDPESILYGRSLYELYSALLMENVNLHLNTSMLDKLQKLSNKCKYPGEDYHIPTIEETIELVKYAGVCLDHINRYRNTKGLPVKELNMSCKVNGRYLAEEYRSRYGKRME